MPGNRRNPDVEVVDASVLRASNDGSIRRYASRAVRSSRWLAVLALLGAATCARTAPERREPAAAAPPPRAASASPPAEQAAPPPPAPPPSPAEKPEATDWALGRPAGTGGKLVRRVTVPSSSLVTAAQGDALWSAESNQLVRYSGPGRRASARPIGSGSFWVRHVAATPSGSFLFSGTYASLDLGGIRLPSEGGAYLARQRPDGSTAYAVRLPEQLELLAPMPDDGAIGAMYEDNVLMAFDGAGTVRWRRSYPFRMLRLEPSSQGVLVTGPRKDGALELRAISDDGALLWERELDADYLVALDAGTRGMAIVGTNKPSRPAALGAARLPARAGIFVATFDDPRSEARWVRAFLGGAELHHPARLEVAIDPRNGHVVASGIVTPSSDFGPSFPARGTIEAMELFVVELGADGTLLWGARFPMGSACQSGLDNMNLEPLHLDENHVRTGVRCHAVAMRGAPDSSSAWIYWVARR